MYSLFPISIQTLTASDMTTFFGSCRSTATIISAIFFLSKILLLQEIAWPAIYKFRLAITLIFFEGNIKSVVGTC